MRSRGSVVHGALFRLSPFERVLTGLCDPDVDNFGRPGASQGFAFCGRKPGADQVGNHVAIEAMCAHKQGLGSAMWADREQVEQFQRAAGLRAETPLSNDRHTFSIGRKPYTFS
jgi:hypothetical protein